MSRLASRPIPLSPSLVQLPLAYRRQLSVRMKALREYKQGCLLFVLPDYLRKAIVDWTLENIPDFHLADGGRELRPHITVVYGFDDDVGGQVKQFLQDTKPFSVRLAELGVFPEGKDGVPFFVRVESPELQRLHYSVMDAFGVEDKHPNYQPHITLGYLRPEVAESYLKGKPPFLPSMVTLDQLEFSTADNHVTSITLSVLPLLGQKSLPYEGKGIVEKPDKLGRRNCYDDQTGKRVPCPKKEGDAKPRQKEPAKPKVEEIPTEKVKAPKPESKPRPEYIKPKSESSTESPQERLTRRKETLKKLSVGKVLGGESLKGGVTEGVALVTLDNGKKGLFKPKKGEKEFTEGYPTGTYYIREDAANNVAEILGMDDLVPPTTIREIDGDVGSIQEFAPGTDAFRAGPYKYGGDEVWMRSAVFDMIIGNADRNEGNWLVTEYGKVSLIDNALSFPEKIGTLIPFGYWGDPERTNALEISDNVRDWSSKGDEIAEALVRSGLSEAAVKLTLDRLSYLKDCKTVGDYMKKLGAVGW